MRLFSYLSLFFLFFCETNYAQNSLPNYRQTLHKEVNSVEKLESFLRQKFYLNEDFSLQKISQQNSKTAQHFDFSISYKTIAIKPLFIKAHSNLSGQFFYLQHNISTEILNEIENIEPPKINIAPKLNERSSQYNTTKIIALDSTQTFRYAYVMQYYVEAQNIYEERIYFSPTEFIKKELKAYADTLLQGKAFMPNPVTSAQKPYGGAFQDAFVKDTTAINIKTIANTGQSSLNSGISPFTFYGENYTIRPLIQANHFQGDSIYLIFDTLQIDFGKITRYNLKYTDNKNAKRTQLLLHNYGYASLDAEQKNISVKGTFGKDSLFHLENAKFKIIDLSSPYFAPPKLATNSFVFSRAESGFEAINAFYHFNHFNDYIESLGFQNLSPQQIKIDPQGEKGENSFFTPIPSPRILFGIGGVDDAEDADVIIHEYTHALSNFASPNSNDGAERRALDEALGDYFACSYSAQYTPYNLYKVFSWDGHNPFWAGRITNATETYLDYNPKKSIYQNAPIWSSALMEIWSAIGKQKTDQLVLESMYYNVANNTFADVANHLILIDSLLFNEKHKCTIFNILKKRKFKAGFCQGSLISEKPQLFVQNSEAFALGKGAIKFLLAVDNFETMDIKISDALGKIIQQEKAWQSPNYSFEAQDLSAGVYYIAVFCQGEKYSAKFIRKP